jgi:hypothetical protein
MDNYSHESEQLLTVNENPALKEGHRQEEKIAEVQLIQESRSRRS